MGDGGGLSHLPSPISHLPLKLRPATDLTPGNGGRVLLEGRDVTDRPAHVRAAKGLGRSFQDARLWPALTVRELRVKP